MIRAISILAVLFFMSGTAALIYQIAWQRLLFAIFGVDTDSVAVVVSVFMVGLGLGALAGGYLADRFPQQQLLLFSLGECAIGLFGIASPSLIEMLDHGLAGSGLLVAGMSSFSLLALPTIIMGATFPLLVANVSSTIHHIGNVVGGLYFANTAGGALGILLVGFVLLNFIDLFSVIYFAASLNLTISFFSYILFRCNR
jgi:MFS family permease